MSRPVGPSMLFAALQPWALTNSGCIRNKLMALVQCVAAMTRGSGTTSTAVLPALLPELPLASQTNATQCDAASASTSSAPSLPLPRPSPIRPVAPAAAAATAAGQGSPRLPVIQTAREDSSAPSPTGACLSAVNGNLSPSPSRTTSLPLLPSLVPARQANLGPNSPPSAVAASTAAASILSASAAGSSPRAPPPPLPRRSSTRLAAPLPPATTTTGSACTPGPAASRSLLPNPTSPPASSFVSSPFASFATAAAASPDSGASSTAQTTDAGDNTSSSTNSTNSGDPTPRDSAAAAAAAATARGASVDPREAAKFAALAASWWRTADGPFAPLHALNPARVRFIRQSLAALMGLDGEAPELLAGLRVLDVGCGGGILSESLARLGAEVHGIDVTRENVAAARLHARTDPRIAARVRYEVISAEDLAASGTALYDVVVASEVLEHVSRPHELLPVLASLLTPPAAEQADGEVTAKGVPAGGALIVSTLNRTPAAWALAIVGAEYLAAAVPRGTHQWDRFITPEELSMMADVCGLQVWHAAGLVPSGPRLSWQLSEDMSVNYIATLRRRQQQPSGGGGSGGDCNNSSTGIGEGG